MKILFIGFRGCGKSRISREVSKKIHLPWISTDKLIEEAIGTSIDEFVKANGWDLFRDKETEVAKGIADKLSLVIDAGGGVVEREDTMKYLKTNAKTIWIDASIQDIIKRLEARIFTHRPLLSEKNWEEDLAKNHERRKPLYEKYADYRVYNSGVPIKEQIQDVVKYIQHCEKAKKQS